MFLIVHVSATVFYHGMARDSITPDDPTIRLPASFLEIFAPIRPRGDLPVGTSSVLAPIIAGPDGLSILFTRRTKHMSAFAGHLSFPGGRIDPQDETALAAALRETHEEIGLRSEQIRVLGYFTELQTHFGTLVICYGGAIAPRDVPQRPTSPREVEEILQVPLDSLRRPGAANLPTLPGHYVATGYEARRIGSPHAPSRTLHYWTLQNSVGAQPTVLWGITGELIARLLQACYGWLPPATPRSVEHVDELQP